MANEPASCEVSGALSRSLRLSQLCAAAPVAFARRDGATVVTLSRSLVIFNCVFATIMNLTFVSALILISFMPQKISVGSTIGNSLQILNTFLVMLVGNIAAYGGRSRIEEMIRCLFRIQQIEKHLYSDRIKSKLWTERRKCATFVITSVYGTCVVCADFALIVILVSMLNKTEYIYKVMLAILLSPYFFAMEMVIMLELQFAFTVLEVCDVLNMFNNALERISHRRDLAVNSKIYPSSATHRTVSQSLVDFATISDVVRTLNQVYGLGLVVMLLSCLLHLIVSPFHVIQSLSDENVPWFKLVIQTAWFVLNLLLTIIIVEPPHMTTVEIERTHQLVSQLKLQYSDQPIRKELDKFSKYLSLNNIEFYPLTVCSVKRPLLATIFGTTVTYLIISVQFLELG